MSLNVYWSCEVIYSYTQFTTDNWETPTLDSTLHLSRAFTLHHQPQSSPTRCSPSNTKELILQHDLMGGRCDSQTGQQSAASPWEQTLTHFEYLQDPWKSTCTLSVNVMLLLLFATHNPVIHYVMCTKLLRHKQKTHTDTHNGILLKCQLYYFLRL